MGTGYSTYIVQLWVVLAQDTWPSNGTTFKLFSFSTSIIIYYKTLKLPTFISYMQQMLIINKQQMASHQSSRFNSSPTATPSVQFMAQHHNTLSKIQINLNQLCSEHDSLMPLLSLLQTLPNLSKTSNTIKAQQKKIQDLERVLECQKQTRHYNEMSSYDPHSVAQIRSVFESLKQCKQSIRQLQEIMSANTASKRESALTSRVLSESIEESLAQHKKSMQYLLSETKNNIEMKYKNNHFNVVLGKEVSKLIPSSLMEQYREQISDVYRDIEVANMGLVSYPPYEIMEFHSFSCQRIEYQFYEINQIINIVLQEERCRNIDIIENRIESLYYQIKGLRKKYLLEFNLKAKEGKSIKQLVNTVKKDLNSLELKYQQTQKLFKKLIEKNKFEQKQTKQTSATKKKLQLKK